MADRFESFEDFWPHYVRAHQSRGNRALHFIGTTAGVGCAALGLVTGRLSLVAAAPLLGYGPAWIGHFLIEGNVPATFGHPLWSLRADFVMWSKILRGTMAAEVERFAQREREGNGAGHPADMPPINVAHGSSGTVN